MCPEAESRRRCSIGCSTLRELIAAPREHLPWHYDHHMGPNQEANWCVTRPWFDYVMGTREPYVGTLRESGDRARHATRKIAC